MFKIDLRLLNDDEVRFSSYQWFRSRSEKEIIELESDFLRLTRSTFGILGYQFKQINFNDWRSSFNVVLNLIINILILYGLYIYDPFQWAENRETSKNFFAQMMVLIARFVIPLIYFSIVGYYFIYGRQFFWYMDLLQQFNSIKQIRFYLFFVLVNNFSFIMIIPILFYGEITWMEFWHQLGSYFLNVQYHMICFFTIFCQFSIRSFFLLIERKLLAIEQFGQLAKRNKSFLVKEIGKMAAICQNVNRLLSFHFMMAWIEEVVYLIISLSLLILNFETNFAVIIDIVIVSIYSTIIPFLNEDIKNRMQKIRELLLKPYWSGCLGYNDNNLIIYRFNPIRLYELTRIYGHDFTIKIYDFWDMDYNFFFSLTLLIVNYVVFIVQTN
ncbi:hypothetical protein SSS_01487 [Sarcoptes scabiei]|nr:hypothetical protein SSS_01487 [Sarcoptes scabiei]